MFYWPGNHFGVDRRQGPDTNGSLPVWLLNQLSVELDVTSLRIKSNNVAVNSDIKEAIESERNNINESIKDEIADIENSLGNVLDYIDNAFKDNIIDENEKSSINERIIQLQKEKADIDAQIQWIAARQISLACCSPWGRKESDTTEPTVSSILPHISKFQQLQYLEKYKLHILEHL